MPCSARLYLGRSCCMFTYCINLFKRRQNTMPLDITKLFVLFSANLFYHWNLWWSSVIHHCRKIEISSFNVCFTLAVILSDIVGAPIVRLDGSFFPLEKLQSDCRNKCNQKEIECILQILNFQYRKAIKYIYTCVSDSGPISGFQNGCTGSALRE